MEAGYGCIILSSGMDKLVLKPPRIQPIVDSSQAFWSQGLIGWCQHFCVHYRGSNNAPGFSPMKGVLIRIVSANLVECGESVDVGGVDVGAALDEAEHLVLVARRARRQEHATVSELH